MNDDLLIYLIVNIVRVCLSVYFLSIFLKKKRPRCFFVLSGAAFWGLNSLLFCFFRNNMLTLASNLICLGVIAFIGFAGRIINKIATVFLETMVGITVEEIAVVLFSLDTMKEIAYINILSLFLFLIVIIVLKMFIHNQETAGISFLHGCVLIAVSLGFINVDIYITEHADGVLAEISLCTLLVINTLILFLYVELQKSLISRRQNDIYKMQADMYREQLDTIRNADESLKILKHDMKHHLFLIKNYLEDGKAKEASSYVDKMTGEIDHTEDTIFCGVDSIDCVINHFRKKIMSAGGIFEADVDSFDGIQLDNYDLNTLLANLLSNAYEATIQTNNPAISTGIGYNKGVLNIEIINTCDPVIKEGKGLFLTTKENSSNHGIGLISAKKVVEKYSGSMDVDYEDGKFTARVILYING